LRDVEIWEKTGSVEPLIERVSKLSLQLEESDQDLYERAAIVCSSFSDSKRYQVRPVLFDIESTSLLLSPTLGDGPQELQGEPTYLEEKNTETQNCVDIDYDHERLTRSSSFEHCK